VTLDTTGIPVRALEGYRKAASLVTSADPGCHIDWALIAAIGRVESNHARFGGNQLDAAGTARPGIIGMVLDGSNGTARITDTDNGVLDRDTVFDRAVGPMQFIPSTWRFAGIDANGDGVKNPENIADASAATAVYLCSGPGDLRRPADLHSAIWRYNASDSYVRMVTSIANAYRHGVRALPASDLTPTTPAASSLSATTSAAAKPAVPRPGSAAAKAATRPPAVPAPAKPAPGSAGTGSTAIPTPARPTTAPPATTTTTTTTTTTSSTTATSTAAPTTTTTTPAPTTPTPTTPVITITSTTCVPDPTATAGPVLATLDPSLPTPCPTAAPTP
jgi:hypothetical protein